MKFEVWLVLFCLLSVLTLPFDLLNRAVNYRLLGNYLKNEFCFYSSNINDERKAW